MHVSSSTVVFTACTYLSARREGGVHAHAAAAAGALLRCGLCYRSSGASPQDGAAATSCLLDKSSAVFRYEAHAVLE
jgi:hypothetical protein